MSTPKLGYAPAVCLHSKNPRHAEPRTMIEQGMIQIPRPPDAAKHVGDHSESAEAEAEADKQRRKIQNRKNQRAHRLRVKGTNAGAGQRLRPFEIGRWRLDEHDVDLPNKTSPAVRGPSTTHISPLPLQTCTELSRPTAEHTIVSRGSRPTAHLRPPPTLEPQPFTFPLSSDHLLHLIQYNVSRAFITNKRAANILHGDPSDCPISGLYRHDTTLQPLDPNIPPSLAPTTLQQNRYHSIWINVIPFPRIRDNLIRHEGLFDHWDLLYDLVGELMTFMPATCVGGTNAPATTTRRPSLLTLPSGSIDADDEVTAGRKGLIVWGEPHEMQSWEATPGFLAKWAWAVEGCEELIEISNRWRVRRGEDPMQVSVSGSCPSAPPPPPPLTLAAIGGV